MSVTREMPGFLTIYKYVVNTVSLKCLSVFEVTVKRVYVRDPGATKFIFSLSQFCCPSFFMSDLAAAFSALTVDPAAATAVTAADPRAVELINTKAEFMPHKLYKSLVSRYAATGTNAAMYETLAKVRTLINKSHPETPHGTPEHSAAMRVFRTMGSTPGACLLQTVRNICAEDPTVAEDRILDYVRSAAHSFTSIEMATRAAACQALADRGTQNVEAVMNAVSDLGTMTRVWKRALPENPVEREAITALCDAVAMHGSKEDKALCQQMMDRRAYRFCDVPLSRHAGDAICMTIDPFFFD